MSKASLFSDGEATDAAYINIRASSSPRLKKIREHCEEIWEIFEAHADPEFRIEIRKNFDARYWEMYLTTYFIHEGFNVHCPKPGPDVGIDVDGKRIWFEAVSPTRGADGSPDQVPLLKSNGGAQDVPEEKIILRYLNSISEKQERQYPNWLKSGVVRAEDAFVIALNPRKIGFDYADSDPPRVLQAAFTVGPRFIIIDRETLETKSSGYHFRDVIKKENESAKPVDSGVFQRDEYATLSGLLCSRIDAGNPVETPGDDFQLVPNPHASVPLPPDFRLQGTYFNVSKSANGYDVTPEER